MKLTKSLAFLIIITCPYAISGCNNVDSETALTTENESTSYITSSETFDEQLIDNDTLELVVDTKSEPITIKSSEPTMLDSKLTLSIIPKLNETVDLDYTCEIIDPSASLPVKVWFEFRRYDPALFYPLNRGSSEEYYLNKIDELEEKGETTELLQMSTYAQKQPVTLVPSSSVLIDGNTSWDLNKEGPVDKIDFSSRVRFTETGEWLIILRTQMEGQTPRITEGISFTITENSSFKGWAKNYAPSQGNPFFEPGETFNVDMVISKAPSLNEQVKITCTLLSNEDIKDVSVQLIFGLKEENSYHTIEIPAKNIITEGGIDWKGNLKNRIPVEYVTTVSFPETGDWEIISFGMSPEAKSNTFACILIHVDKEYGRVGWTEPHRNQDIPIEADRERY